MTNSQFRPQENLTVLEVPAVGDYARVVRLTAANLATLAGLGIEDVEDVRMAAEEAFVYSLATAPGGPLHMEFLVEPGHVDMTFYLGNEWNADDPDEPSLAYSALILQAICDVYEIVGEQPSLLHLVKNASVADAR